MQIQNKSSILVKDDANKTIYSRILDIPTDVTEYNVRKIKIAASAVDAPIDFGGVSDVNFALITSDLSVSLKINNSPVDTSRGKLFVFSGDTGGFLTELSVSNPNIEDAELEVVLGGN